jgi:peptidoglycan hydrolase-like protein with peptidoglycan-binding domain
MKRLVVIFVAALSIAVGADASARPRRHHRHHPVAHAIHRTEARTGRAAEKTRATKRRARRRAGTNALPTSYSDELALSPALLRQVQRNLVDGGYYRGAVDGRLTPTTRHALAEFQHEYHLDATGHLDRRTAEALLGHDTVASAAPPVRG